MSRYTNGDKVSESKTIAVSETITIGKPKADKLKTCPFCHDENRIRELEEQIEDMKSCCICGKLGECEVWSDTADDVYPIHNVNDAPCDEWELG